jgi:O-antigen ligase
MAVRTGNRFPLSQAASVAVAETRLAALAAPRIVRHLAPIVAWAVASIALGLVVGLAAVALPPMGAFGIVAAPGLVLLWVMPDLPLVWPRLIRKTFFVMLIADLCIPNYYMVQFAGLPWISARRIATFSLIVPFLIAIAASSDVRRRITERMSSSLLIFICAAGYLVMATLSITTSLDPSLSLSTLTDAILSWYVPFFAMIYIVRDEDDAVFILKIICFCAIFITGAGLLERLIQRNIFVELLPKGMLTQFIENNPVYQHIVPDDHTHWRDGLYRSFSTFTVALSFGEFEIIVIPIGLFFALFRENVLERILGWAVVFGGIIGIFCSGSRGAWMAVLTSVPVFIAIWSIRKANNNRASLAPAIVSLTGVVSFVVVIGLIVFWQRAHNIFLGGGETAASNEGRYLQWAAGIPFIKSNPITGYGLAAGGGVIQQMSIDSYVLSLLLETGVPGLVFFGGLLLLPIWHGVRNFISDMSESGAVAGALACSFVAFTIYRLVLSQRENHMLIFSLLAITVVMNCEYARKQVPERPIYKQPRKTDLRAKGDWPGGRVTSAERAASRDGRGQASSPSEG